MRLIHIQSSATSDGPPELTLCDFIVSDEYDQPAYAILSHRWREEEVLFTDITGDHTLAKRKKGYAKLEECCKIALEYGYHYIWSDTCCIDKSSSAELSEAINSMYEYYAKSQLCIAYLDDVEDDPEDEGYLQHATWFSRGWTLQELLASKRIYFYSKGWKQLGDKQALSGEITMASGISGKILAGASLDTVCISEKMSWASRRTTTRPEDRAYSLMGLFGVNMPPLYGEGAEKAFRRLQLEILQTTTDQTLFAWESETVSGDMLAPSVSHFRHGDRYENRYYDDIIIESIDFRDPTTENKPDFSMTNAGLHIQLPIIPVTSRCVAYSGRSSKPLDSVFETTHFAFVRCKLKHDNRLVAICLRGAGSSFSRIAFDGQSTHHLNPSILRHKAAQFTKFSPVWVAKKSEMYIEAPSKLLQKTVKSVAFELWFKGRSGVDRLLSDQVMDTSSQLTLDGASKRLGTLGDNVPQDFALSKLPLQHYLTGSISARGFGSEFITFARSRKRFGTSESFNAIAFGVIDGFLWMDYPAITSDSERSAYSQQYAFPEGSAWTRGGDTMRLAPSPTGYFFTHGTGHSFGLHGQVVQSHEEPEVHTLRIYVIPAPKRIQDWQRGVSFTEQATLTERVSYAE